MTDTAEQIENDVRAALAADVYSQYDETVTVVDYQATVTGMDDQGNIHVRHVYSGEQPAINMLGPARWTVMTLERCLEREIDADWSADGK